MADPQTMGAAVAAIVSLAASEGFKSVVGEAAKEAYKALKSKIAAWASEEVTAVEKHPESESRQKTLAEMIDQQPAPEQAAVKELATKLSSALKGSAAEGPTGAILRRIEAVNLILEDIEVTEGLGVVVEDSKTTGDFSIKHLKVGPGRGKE